MQKGTASSMAEKQVKELEAKLNQASQIIEMSKEQIDRLTESLEGSEENNR